MTPALQVAGLRKRFGGVAATKDVSLTVMPGERRLLIGPNGAGKTTLFNLICGDLSADAGSIQVFGHELRGQAMRRRSAAGLGRTYQVLTLFPGETMLHNVSLAAIGNSRVGWVPWGSFARRHDVRFRAQAALAQVGLEQQGARVAAETSYGERRRLELAMVLVQEPRLLLLDEPLAGLSAPERVTVRAVIEALPRSVSIVLIEHDMDVALALADQITLLNYGSVVLEGPRTEVVADPRTREVYFGG